MLNNKKLNFFTFIFLKQNLFLTIALIFFSYILIAQTSSIRFNRLTIKQGLSQSTINCILQDENGFMWYGTQDGLNKYDGYEFTEYKHRLNKQNSLSHSFITSLHEDKQGGVWVGTQNGGLNYKDKRTNNFKHVKLGAKLNNAHIRAITEDEFGALWIGTNKFGVIRYDPFKDSISVYNVNNGLLSNKISALLIHGKEILVATEGKGLAKINLLTGSLIETSNLNKRLNDPSIICLYKIDDITILIGTNQGLNILSNGEIENFSDPCSDFAISSVYGESLSDLWLGTIGHGLIHYTKEEGDIDIDIYVNNNYDPASLVNDLVLSIYKDQSGNIWIGTQGGMSFFDPLKQSFLFFTNVYDSEESLIDKNVWTIHDQDDSLIWVGTRKGITRINNNDNTYYSYPYKSTNLNLPENHDIWDITTDNTNRVWAATNGGLFLLEPYNNFKNARYKKVQFREPKNKMDDDVVYDLNIDQNNILWLACKEGVGVIDINTFNYSFITNDPDTKNTIPAAECRTVISDSKGNIWLGFSGGGLTKVEINKIEDKPNYKFTNYISDTSDKQSLNDNTVLSIWEEPDGILWLGTYGGGLNRFDPLREEFKYYIEENGLSKTFFPSELNLSNICR